MPGQAAADSGRVGVGRGARRGQRSRRRATGRARGRGADGIGRARRPAGPHGLRAPLCHGPGPRSWTRLWRRLGVDVRFQHAVARRSLTRQRELLESLLRRWIPRHRRQGLRRLSALLVPVQPQGELRLEEPGLPVRKGPAMSLRCCGWGLLASLLILSLGVSTFDRHADQLAVQAVATTLPSGNGESLYQLASDWTTDQGEHLKLAELRGGPRVLAMMFTNCPSLCPTLVRDRKALDAAMPAKCRACTEYVLVTIDPEHDDPAALKEFRARMGLDSKRWVLLRGNASDTQQLAAVLGFNYGKGDGRNYTHSNLVTVLDGQGAIVHQQVGLGEDLSRAVAMIGETRAR